MGTLTLDTLMSALHLIMDQQAAEPGIHEANHCHTQMSWATADAFSVTASSTLAMPSPAVSVSSTFTEVFNLRHTAETAPQPTPQLTVSAVQVAQTMQAAPRWYCVTRGHAIGVFVSWANVLPLITSVPGSIYQCHANFGAVLTVFIEAAGNGTVQIIF